jgi:hypothetical protein
MPIAIMKSVFLIDIRASRGAPGYFGGLAFAAVAARRECAAVRVRVRPGDRDRVLAEGETSLGHCCAGGH